MITMSLSYEHIAKYCHAWMQVLLFLTPDLYDTWPWSLHFTIILLPYSAESPLPSPTCIDVLAYTLLLYLTCL